MVSCDRMRSTKVWSPDSDRTFSVVREAEAEGEDRGSGLLSLWGGQSNILSHTSAPYSIVLCIMYMYMYSGASITVVVL